MIPQSLARHLQTAITLESFTGGDGGGAATYGAPVTYLVRIANDLQAIGKGGSGQDIMSRRQVIFDRILTINLRDRITLPDAPTQPPILSFHTSQSPAGGSLGHTTVYL